MKNYKLLVVILVASFVFQACATPKKFEKIEHPVMVGNLITPTKTVSDFSLFNELEIRELYDRTRHESSTSISIRTTTQASVVPVMEFINQENKIGSVNWMKNEHRYVFRAHKYNEDAYFIRIFDQ